MDIILEYLLLTQGITYCWFTTIDIYFLKNSKLFLKDIFSKQEYFDSKQGSMVGKLPFSQIFILKFLESVQYSMVVMAYQLTLHWNPFYLHIFSIQDHKLDLEDKFQQFILIYGDIFKEFFKLLVNFIDIPLHQNYKKVFQKDIHHKLLILNHSMVFQEGIQHLYFYFIKSIRIYFLFSYKSSLKGIQEFFFRIQR